MQLLTRTLTHTVCLCLLLLAGCVEPYSPEVIEGPNNFLVVDGTINGNGVTTVRLSRTQNISVTGPPYVESGATLRLEEEQGAQYPMVETAPGTYTNEGRLLDRNRKYRLYIRTESGQEYASEYVTVKQTPPIDEVGWEALDNTLQIYVNTHDPNNDTRYYRWEYEATWAFTAAYATYLKYDDSTGTIVARTRADENIYNCWKTDYSTSLKLGTSAKLSSDVIYKYPILALPSGSEELRLKYSVLVKQYALTQEAYVYWETLRKNTESIGTLFDPLPSQLTGNVHSLSNAAEPVIGYVGASSGQEKRIFVSHEELPREWRTFYPVCELDSVLPTPPNETFKDLAERFKGGYYMPVGEIYPPGAPSPIGYLGATLRCVDCRLRGTNVKPDFWE
ncbi:DUF4249 domain-containing protein [Pontibacter sp. E15-1]|uniref:DUF4249 domain-containing protein n=1 Tax=Pontibacter sp. E15-1 TaxID=2919918 RepID=UPI001F4F5839|nr:DUF4249 domain-containing protein [Pontibacter sp. E15-1]MCJ8164848.1 DUF4249 domain-containing protein [Pontibacter sp. E15-1]